jgi:hypothetical protein
MQGNGGSCRTLGQGLHYWAFIYHRHQHHGGTAKEAKNRSRKETQRISLFSSMHR